jgi:hypothetical protein
LPFFFGLNLTGISSRVDLAPFVEGIIVGLSERYKLQDFKIKQITRRDDEKKLLDEFLIEWKDDKIRVDQEPELEYEIEKNMSLAFPFHFVIDTNAEIIQTGRSLRKIAPRLSFSDFDLIKPHLVLHDKKTFEVLHQK